MLKALAPFLTAVAVAFPASAEEEWKSKAIENVKTYSRVKDASWSESGSLWLFAYDADVAWETVTEGFICLQLNAAGKPEGKAVLVSWFEQAAALQGKSKRLAKVWCE